MFSIVRPSIIDDTHNLEQARQASVRLLQNASSMLSSATTILQWLDAVDEGPGCDLTSLMNGWHAHHSQKRKIDTPSMESEESLDVDATPRAPRAKKARSHTGTRPTPPTSFPPGAGGGTYSVASSASQHSRS